jgi:hypothetical protein
VQTDDSEAASADTFTQMPELENAPVILDVTSDIAAFLAGTPNHGWVLNCTGADGWHAVSMEGTTITQRPTLQIAYTIPVAAGYPAWQLAKFGANAGAAGTLPTEDPDDDRTVNLLEYALNANPLRASIGAQPAVAADGPAFTFKFIRNLDATDLTFRVEATAALGTVPWIPVATWTHSGGWTTEPGYVVSENADAVTVTFTASEPAGFFRLAVTLP